MFKALLANIEKNIANAIMKADVKVNQRPVSQPVISGNKVGRNDPCHCGSGKKFKKCHGKND